MMLRQIQNNIFRLKQRGSVLIETAIVLPLILFIILGGIQIFAFFFNINVIANAANQAALAGSSIGSPATQASVVATVNQYLANVPPINFSSSAPTTTVTATFCPYTVGSTGIAQTTPCVTTGCSASTPYILNVNVSYPFTGMFSTFAGWKVPFFYQNVTSSSTAF